MTAPNRVTIIPSDSFCSVDGISFTGVDMSSVSKEIHAMQWFGTWGDQEIADPNNCISKNEVITNLDSYQGVLNSYWDMRHAQESALKKIIDEQTIIEV